MLNVSTLAKININSAWFHDFPQHVGIFVCNINKIIKRSFCNLDERIAVENTTIPEHLEQMIEVLKIEEHENGSSSAVSYNMDLSSAKKSFVNISPLSPLDPSFWRHRLHKMTITSFVLKIIPLKLYIFWKHIKFATRN